MSTRDSQLDQRLQALFHRLDTAADFDARLMARLRAEPPYTVEGAIRARQQESERYRKALLELRSWRRSIMQILTLDTLGIACLLVIAVITAWPHLNRDAIEGLRQYGAPMVTLLGVLLSVIPLVGMWAERNRGPIHF
jgi:hypothetical protein